MSPLKITTPPALIDALRPGDSILVAGSERPCILRAIRITRERATGRIVRAKATALVGGALVGGAVVDLRTAQWRPVTESNL
jgi:hypothetical protein